MHSQGSQEKQPIRCVYVQRETNSYFKELACEITSTGRLEIWLGFQGCSLLFYRLFIVTVLGLSWDFPGGSEIKASACNVGDLGSIPGLGRSPGEGKGNPLQYSCLENPMDRGAWWATVHGVAKSRTRLSDFTSTFTLGLSCGMQAL